MPENLYIVIIALLFLLAVSDLIVGVSNDAVNFLNSSIGSKVAPKRVIFIIASLGILVGTTFSGGMMEVARKGIFHPDQFVFTEIMIIFLAVMLTDVILLDAFNTLALPTSTTVSIVFELLGAAVMVAALKIHRLGDSFVSMSDYINSDKALLIISGILFSVVIAFLLGALVQYISRIIFSFNYEKTQRYFGAVWGGVALTAITYFILIKGAKGSSIISQDSLQWIQAHSFQIMVVSFIAWAVIMQALYAFFRVNIFRIIILLGTFALALAFASNDLVNFIGVPLAGLKSFQLFHAEGQSLAADEFTMEALIQPVKSNTYLLIIAGLIMVITLWLSKKARNVTRTEINLSRQAPGEERFGSTAFSRYIVRKTVVASHSIVKALPRKWVVIIEKRFRMPKNNHFTEAGKASFDLVRASVNLTIASIIISLATSFKLPLSTTYVTFMVAMGTSLSDRAWGRESAVYRITGVLTVIGGWFITAFIAFTASGLVALVISFGGFGAILLLAALAVFLIIRSHRRINREAASQKEAENDTAGQLSGIHEIIKREKSVVSGLLEDVTRIISSAVKQVSEEDRKGLGNLTRDVKQVETTSGELSNSSLELVNALQKEQLEIVQYFIQIHDHLKEVAGGTRNFVYSGWHHVLNNHKGLIKTQVEELQHLNKESALLFFRVKKSIESSSYGKVDEILLERESFLELVNGYRVNQIKRIKKNVVKTKNSILFFNLLNAYKHLGEHFTLLLTQFEELEQRLVRLTDES